MILQLHSLPINQSILYQTLPRVDHFLQLFLAVVEKEGDKTERVKDEETQILEKYSAYYISECVWENYHEIGL